MACRAVSCRTSFLHKSSRLSSVNMSDHEFGGTFSFVLFLFYFFSSHGHHCLPLFMHSLSYHHFVNSFLSWSLSHPPTPCHIKLEAGQCRCFCHHGPPTELDMKQRCRYAVHEPFLFLSFFFSTDKSSFVCRGRSRNASACCHVSSHVPSRLILRFLPIFRSIYQGAPSSFEN